MQVAKNSIFTEDGKEQEFDLLVWATGAEPSSLLKNTGLKLSKDGYIEVNFTQSHFEN